MQLSLRQISEDHLQLLDEKHHHAGVPQAEALDMAIAREIDEAAREAQAAIVREAEESFQASASSSVRLL